MKKLVISATLVFAITTGTALSMFASNHEAKEKSLTHVSNPDHPYVTAPEIITPEELVRDQSNIDTIYTHYGVFYKVPEKDSSISESHTAYKIDDITPETEQIVHYGYFVKK